MKPQKNVTVLLLVLSAVLVTVHPRAFGGPDPPVMNGATAYYTGNQSDGVIAVCPPIEVVCVWDLTTDIAPVGIPGIWLMEDAKDGSNGSPGERGGNGASGTSDEMGIIFLGSHAITTDAGLFVLAFPVGLLAMSSGGNGGAGGDWGLFGSAGNGGSGGYGSPVTILTDGYGPIDTRGRFGIGILASSTGGSGGNGGDAGGIYVEGGNGGRGANGGPVTVWDTFSLLGSPYGTASITTDGSMAPGIYAASGGGAGGDGGSAYGGGAGAGAGGESGDGGDVLVAGSRPIETQGRYSCGIFAQSVGGFGGGGGTGGGLGSWGGAGGASSDAGSVDVGRGGAIQTWGFESHAIFAQSVGGGGGSAGDMGGLVAVGGSGSTAGDGAAVSVISTGTLQTHGTSAVGIFAQSIGGGGGAGGGSGGFIALGGSGNSSGDGGNVKVDNRGSIATMGSNSDSIFAQSIGGGGGRARSGGGVISVGGSGGGGGTGGEVSVINNGSLSTIGHEAYGILAESIGAGGGRGASAYAVFYQISSAIGGSGEGGGDGKKVEIESGEVTITTAGDFSHGIYGRSLGGGGGGGGASVSVARGIDFTGNSSIGGWGGGGGNGGIVDLTSHSRVITQGQQAHALLAESVGGGGGSGGNAIALSETYGGVEGLPGVGINLSLGGKGGDGGTAQAATITSTGNLTTSGSRSYGAFAQSAGGGGGDGGYSVSGGLSFKSVVATMAIGGSGGKGGAGNKAFVDSAGSIDTQGDSAYGILAQSVGGGGGAGGNSIAVTIALSDLQNMVQQLIVPKMSPRSAVGGSGGWGGAGGAAEVTNEGPIATKGALAHGILAQSIGGGGGAGGDDISLGFSLIPNPAELLEVVRSFAFDGGVKLGRSGGGGGDGSSATVDNSGAITTHEDFATGILAQSVGGGGGVGGLSIKDKYGLIQNQVPSLKLERLSSGSGSGAVVTVDNSGDITTNGGFAHGILAQSVGGGGGFAAIKDDIGVSTLDDSLVAAGVSVDGALGFGVGFAGSAGGSGSAGAVEVTHTGSITTLGDMSHGILAQSAAGYGTAGPVTVTLESDIMAYGMDSDGIHAQSVGRGGRGDIFIDIGGGTVRGGSGDGAGVNIDGGANNTLTNAGTVSALSGTAILGSSGHDTVHNDGLVIGKIDLGTGINAFNNHVAGVFNMGAVVDLGAGNDLTNAGILSPGGLGNIMTATLIGDLIQPASGVLEMEIGGFTPGSFDALYIEGTLTGAVSPLSLSSPMGSINFSLLPGYDIASEIGPGQSLTLQFLSAYSLDGFASGMSYSVPGGPWGFQYEVLQLDAGLFLRAVNTVPAPGALLLGTIGLALLGWRRRRMRW